MFLFIVCNKISNRLVFSPLFYIFKYKCFVISFFFINFATFLQVLHLHDITKKKIYQ